MIRLALVGWSEGEWRIFRQEQWMAEVRRNPSIAGFPRTHFDLVEAGYRDLVSTWATDGSGLSREMAVNRIIEAGGVEIAPR